MRYKVRITLFSGEKRVTPRDPEFPGNIDKVLYKYRDGSKIEFNVTAVEPHFIELLFKDLKPNKNVKTKVI